MARGAAVALLAALAAASCHAAQVTPVQKVVALMTGMGEKGKKEKHEEGIQFATFKQFCTSTSASKTRAIADANEKIEQLQADIEKFEATAERLGQEIQGHDTD